MKLFDNLTVYETNDWYSIELLLIHRNIWNNLILSTSAKLNCLKKELFDNLFECKQMTDFDGGVLVM